MIKLSDRIAPEANRLYQTGIIMQEVADKLFVSLDIVKKAIYPENKRGRGNGMKKEVGVSEIISRSFSKL